MRPSVLFLCTGRIRMAEGLLRHLAAGRFDSFSAGTAPAVINPGAVAPRREHGKFIRTRKPVAQ